MSSLLSLVTSDGALVRGDTGPAVQALQHALALVANPGGFNARQHQI